MNLNRANDEISVPFLDDKKSRHHPGMRKHTARSQEFTAPGRDPEPYLREYTNRNNNASIVINFIAAPKGNDMDIVTNFTERVNEVLFYCSLFSRK